MLVNKAAERKWSATDYPGIERSLFRNDETGGRASSEAADGLEHPCAA